MRITAIVKLHKHTNAVIEVQKGIYEVHTHEQPVDGRANEDVIRQLADYFKIPKSSVRVVSGAASKRKVLEIKLRE